MFFRPPPVYPLTDRRLSGGRSHSVQVRGLLEAGLRFVQVREKEAVDRDLLPDLEAAVEAAREGGALLMINDRADLALLSGAGGVHLGEEDLPLDEARRLLGPAVVLGRSSHDVASAREAERAGADYVAFGPVFATDTKPDARRPAGLEALRAVRDAVAIPLVAIGGITLERAGQVLEAGADTVAVIRDLAGAPDPKARARRWVEEVGGEDRRDRGLLFLTGFMGSGKTSVGALLAEKRGQRFVDLDGEIEARFGLSVAEIFERRGEAAFRRTEEEILRAIPRGADAVVALGGGTLLHAGNADRVRSLGTLLWLDCPLEEARSRWHRGPERPLLGEGGRAATALLARRLPGYRKAHLRVDTSGRSVDEIGAEILVRLEGAAGGGGAEEGT